MFRGAIILGIGFTLGYGKAVQDSQEIKDLLLQVLWALRGKVEEFAEQPTDDRGTGVVVADAVETPVDSTADPINPTTPTGE